MIIGITGGIGSGKSTIAQELAKRGYAVYDCDREAKRLIEQRTDLRQAIIALLGEEAFIGERYNTPNVSARVFAEPALLAQLNAIVHPAVKADIASRNDAVLFVESAILIESGFDRLCDAVVLVEAPEDVRIARTVTRDYKGQMTLENIEKVRARMRQQTTIAPKQPAITLCNDGVQPIATLVDALLRQLSLAN